MNLYTNKGKTNQRPAIAALIFLGLAAMGTGTAAAQQVRISTHGVSTNRPNASKAAAVSAVAVHPPPVAHSSLQGSNVPAQGVTYTCDANFATYGPAGLCAALNSILPPIYSSTFTNANASIYILFDPDAGLGTSVQYGNSVPYSSYQASLLSESTDPADAYVPATEPAIFGSLPVGVTSALARHLGITGATSITAEGETCSTPGVGDCYDAIVHVVTPAALLAGTGDQGLSYRSLSGSTNGTTNNYDFFSVVEHETDEVLGTSSCVNYASPATTNPPTCVSAEDLFRYTAPGVRIFDTFANSYFSADGGVTDLDNNTYNTTQGAGDWGDFSQICVFVQDAEACPSGFSPGVNFSLDITNDGPGGTPGPEVAMLNAVGYNLNAKQSQTITFATLPNVTYGVSPITLTATASSGLPVSYTVTGPATLNGSTLTITGAGMVSVTASQGGDDSYSAATPVLRSFMVNKALLTVTANSTSRPFGAANPTFTFMITGFVRNDPSSVVSGTATETTTATSASAPGQYPITFSTKSLTAANYTFTYVNGTLSVVSGSAAGRLSGAGTSVTTTANLTAEGAADWVHWGGAALIRKNGVTPQISNYTVIGSGSVRSYTNDPRALSWTDGTPTLTGSDNNGLLIELLHNGFSFTAPADTTTRVLTIHVGGWFSGGTLTAVLSDGSSASFVDSTTSVNAQYDRNYTLTYNSALPGKTLTVSWVMTSGTGNVTLNGAALAQIAPSISVAAGAPQSAVVNTQFGTPLQALVKDAQNNPVSGVPVTFTAPSTGPGAVFGSLATATEMTNGSGIATAPALKANSQAGTYTVTASTPAVATPATFSLTNTSVSGSLSGAATSLATTANLTAEGTTDWIHWEAAATLIRKSGVTPQISSYSVLGSGTVQSYTNDPRALSWTGGTPTPTGSDNNGIYISLLHNGLSFTAPADTTTRVLTMHVGGWFSGGTLTAQLSDGSAASFVDTTTSVNAQYDRNYTLTYNSALPGKTLTVSWVMTSGTGNVTLNGAALK
jgi:hypothetical protein